MAKLTALEQFKTATSRVVLIPEAEWKAFIPHLAERTFEKHDYLIRAGDQVDNFYFIVSGLVRFFYSTRDGKEFNKHFAMENGFAGSFQSFLLDVPCPFFVQALEATQVLVLPDRQTQEAFYQRHPCWERLSRKNAEHLVFIKEAREKELLLDSLEVRYRRFLKEFPGLAERIPQYHIASFLGVTDVALSRIRRNFKK